MPKKVKKGKKKGKGKKGKKKTGSKSSQEGTLERIEKFVEFSFKTRVDEIAVWKSKRDTYVRDSEEIRCRIQQQKKLQTETSAGLRHRLEGSKSSMERANSDVRDAIAQALAQKAQLRSDMNSELEEIRQNSKDLKARQVERHQYLQDLLEYQAYGQGQLKTQLELTKQRLADLKEQAKKDQETTVRRSEDTKRRLSQALENRVVQSQVVASEKALRRMSLSHRAEVSETQWLKAEVLRHEAEQSRLLSSCQEFERSIAQTLSSIPDHRMLNVGHDADYYLQDDEDDSTDTSPDSETESEDEEEMELQDRRFSLTRQLMNQSRNGMFARPQDRSKRLSLPNIDFK